MNLHMLEIYTVTSWVITEYECTDLWSLMFWVVRPRSNLHQDKDTKWVEHVGGFHLPIYLMLIYEMFYYECHDNVLVWISNRHESGFFVIDD
jgi:hypothetical protein